jgi:ATP-dependent RNA helicase DeaD
VLSLAGLECGELHGGLTQSVRSTAMSRFRNGSPSLLVATDVAARGLDTHVDAVLNIDMPLSIKGMRKRFWQSVSDFDLLCGFWSPFCFALISCLF